MGGEELSSARMGSRGVVGDRCYCVVDLEKQRAAEAAYVPLRWGGLPAVEAALISEPQADCEPPPVRIRFPDGSGRDSGDADLAEWLTRKLGHPASLWRDPDAGGASLAGGRAESSGAAAKVEAGSEPGDTPERGYDRAPVHLLTTASLAQAAAFHPEGRFERARFRPNIVLDTGDARGFLEQGWIGRMLALGPEIQLELVKPCERCVMTTLPQGDLGRDPKVLTTLTARNSGNMGVYARVLRPGSLQRGDRARLL